LRRDLAKLALKKAEEEDGHANLAYRDLEDLGLPAGEVIRLIQPPSAAAFADRFETLVESSEHQYIVCVVVIIYDIRIIHSRGFAIKYCNLDGIWNCKIQIGSDLQSQVVPIIAQVSLWFQRPAIHYLHDTFDTKIHNELCVFSYFGIIPRLPRSPPSHSPLA
jgi:hypothetical protein